MIEVDPFVALHQIIGGYIVPRCLHVVADLGVADALDEMPRTAADLAHMVGADPDALRRVMSLLAAHGVFEVEDGMFHHSQTSRLLRNDHPRSLRAFARMMGLPFSWSPYLALEYSVRTGLPAAQKSFPEGLWAYMAEHKEEDSLFNAAMADKARAAVAGVMGAYDFTGFDLVGDIGGGLGHLLRAVVETAPTAKGVLFDLPHVIEKAQNFASERFTLQGGDFFSDALPVCDAYLMMEVIHDWADDQAVEILKAVRRAAPAHAKLLLIEQMIPEDPGPHWSKFIDIHMLALLGGRQRTIQEYKALFEKACFSFVREINTGAEHSILEAIPV